MKPCLTPRPLSDEGFISGSAVVTDVWLYITSESNHNLNVQSKDKWHIHYGYCLNIMEKLTSEY